MIGRPLRIMFLNVLLLIFCIVSYAEMASENYRIHSSVHSAGGVPIGSTNYQLNSTVGQSSPLPDPTYPPFSDSYDLYPGFWYTLVNIGITCPCDFNGDKDVDGSDLAEYLFDSGGLSLDIFAIDFGKDNCP